MCWKIVMTFFSKTRNILLARKFKIYYQGRKDKKAYGKVLSRLAQDRRYRRLYLDYYFRKTRGSH